jgi:signal peptidase I
LALIAQPVKVEGTAMEPALMNGDRLMVQKMVGELRRGDIVIFHYPKDKRKSLVERIIALPGETISIDGFGAVYINNSELHEPYVSPDWNRSPRALAESKLAADEYFVMGDSRDRSFDSRTFGLVERNLIYGKVMGRYWPIWR